MSDVSKTPLLDRVRYPSDLKNLSVEQLKQHIDAFVKAYAEAAEPFVWTKSKVHQRRVKGQRLSDL